MGKLYQITTDYSRNWTGGEHMPKVTLTESQREQELFETTIKKYAGAALMSTAELLRGRECQPGRFISD